MVARRGLGHVIERRQLAMPPTSFERFGWLLHAAFVAIVIYCIARG